MPESWWGNAIFSLIPTIVLGLIFWMVMRMIVRGDRTARMQYDRIEAEERAKMGLPPRAVARAATVVPADAPEAPASDAGRPGSPPGAPAPGDRTPA